MNNPKNEKWTGAMARVECGNLRPKDVDIPMFSSLEQLSVGEQPWVVLAKAFHWRWGPNSWPCPGVGSWVKPVSAHMALLVFCVEDFVKAGCVGLNDVLPFLETPSGQELMKTSLTIVDFRRHAGLAWVPFGFCVAPLHVPMSLEEAPSADGAENAQGMKCDDFPENGLVWSMAVFDAALAGQVSEQAWAPLTAMNKAHFDMRATLPLWSTRSSAYELMSSKRTS